LSHGAVRPPFSAPIGLCHRSIAPRVALDPLAPFALTLTKALQDIPT